MERLDQLRPVIDEASRYTGPQLTGGDFNTNEWYWVMNVVSLLGGHRTVPRFAVRWKSMVSKPPFQALSIRFRCSAVIWTGSLYET